MTQDSSSHTFNLRESLKATKVNAGLAGHYLGPFIEVNTPTGGYQAICWRCGRTTLKGESGVMCRMLG